MDRGRTDKLGVGKTTADKSEPPVEQSRGTGTDAGQTTDQVDDGERITPAGAEPSDSPDLIVTKDSESDPIISIVLPTMNEEDGIGECIYRAIEGIQQIGLPAEIIISDDSTDRTPEIAEKWGARVVEPDRKGYGYAYKYGFQFVRGNIVVMGDGDTTYDFTELPKLLKPILRGQADLILGSRFEGTINPGAMPKLHQYVGNPLLTRFLNTFYDASVSDAHSGFRAIRRDALEAMDLRSDGMEFASEMVMDASASGQDIDEVPITYYERRGEETLDSFRDGWRHVKFMLMNAPGYLYAGPGIVFVILGLITTGLSFYDVRAGGITFSIHTSILGSLLTIVGYQIGLLSVFTTLAANPIRTPDDSVTRWIRSDFKFGHGASLGFVLLGAGASWYAISIVNFVVAGGYTAIPMVPSHMVAFSAIVLGVQTVFSSFYLSALQANGRSEDTRPGSLVNP